MIDCCNKKHSHPDHGKELSRINRIVGQLEGVKKMIEEQRYCPDIITQLRAASSATKSLEATILEAHLESCVAEAFESGNNNDQKEKIGELIRLFKRYD
jgi:DNA-binding FrmR family transcriptional regulator